MCLRVLCVFMESQLNDLTELTRLKITEFYLIPLTLSTALI